MADSRDIRILCIDFKVAVMTLLSAIWDFFVMLFSFGFSKKPPPLGVYVKETSGNTVFVELDPRWDIRNVKQIVAKKLELPPDSELKIIFAGRELQEHVIIQVVASYCPRIPS